jgi:antitoxin VapB
MPLDTAKLFVNGQSQAVRLPKEYRFSGDEVGIKKIGDIVLLFSKDTAWDGFLNGQPASDDFGDAILSARKENNGSQRDSL